MLRGPGRGGRELTGVADIPAGFSPLVMRQAGFIEANGPLFGRMEAGRLVMGLRVEDRHCNAVGICHGGMLATLADMLLAMGSSLQAELSSFLMTVSLTCDFIAAAPLGAWIEGRVDVLRVTRSLVFSQGLLTHEDAPVLRASGVLRRPSQPDPAFASALVLPQG